MYQQSSGMDTSSGFTAQVVKPGQGSEALQDLIDILQQNYLSDCPYCDGTGRSLRDQVCKYCDGKGQRQSF